MAEAPKEPRRVSLVLNVIVGSLTQDEATELEDQIRDIIDEYENAQVNATRGNERPVVR